MLNFNLNWDLKWAVLQVLKLLYSLLIFIGSYSLVWGASLSQNDLAFNFQKKVSPHLNIPTDAVIAYSKDLKKSLRNASITIESPQYVVLVDRNPNVQAVMIFWGSDSKEWQLIGAAPTSTGLPGTFDHFLTPLGVFNHSLDNPDFRAEGTRNQFGFRGYGQKGMRVYDFGWVNEHQGWGDRKMAVMRLQMHATDPELAESLLGTPKSKGCIRIPAAMNDYIDRYGLLDADYDEGIKRGVSFWVMRQDREPTDTPGRYLVVVESAFNRRPLWSPAPKVGG